MLSLVTEKVRGVFERDPERDIPADPDAIVSPADGRIIYALPYQEGNFPPLVSRKGPLPLWQVLNMEAAGLQEGIVVGIFMGLADVHVNRAPIAGVVERIVHTQRESVMSMWRMTVNDVLGRNLFPVPGEHVVKNSRNAVWIEGDFPVCVLQIADRHVGRILCYPREGQKVAAGERIGMITFGSQVDLFLPKGKCILSVKVRDRVKAGSSVIARLVHEPATAGL